MGTRKNKTRLGEWDFTIQKPMANDVVMRNGLFVAIKDGYIIPADGTTEIEGCAINDRYSGENNEHRYCIYQPKRNWETFTMEVDNGTITQADVGKTFRIADSNLQHINYPTKADRGGQFRLEEVLNDNLGTFTYCFDTQFAPQGPQGNDGDTPSLEMGTVTKLQPDENPTAELVSDPNDPTKYVLNLGLPSGATGPKGSKGDKGDTGNPGSTGAPGQDGEDGTDGTNGTNGTSPHREGDWNGGTTYTYLAMVRYPDQNNEYWTWIWSGTEPTSGSTPGVDSRRGKMNKDGESGPQGEQGGTIVIPVEGKPGKDGIGVDGRDGTDGISPLNRGIWSSTAHYDPLNLVRAWTGKYNVFGDEIMGWYITNNGAYGSDPKDGGPRALVVEDGNGLAGAKEYMDELHRNCVGLGLQSSKTEDDEFYDDTSNTDVGYVTFDRYTGNRDMLLNAGAIKILKTGHYQISGHCIIKLNTGGNKYLNIGRYSVALASARSGSAKQYIIATAKSGGPYVSSGGQGPWLDLSLCVQVDLYEGDVLMPLTRCQSDTVGLKSQHRHYTYTIIGGDDTSGSVPGQLDIDGYFATYINVEMLSYDTFNDGNVRESI